MSETIEAKTGEIRLSYTVEDFEPGDRVYCLEDRVMTILLGTVRNIEGSTIEIESDDGGIHWVSIDTFDPAFYQGTMWGRVLPVGLLTVGARVSERPFFSKARRRFATVTTLVLPKAGEPGQVCLLRDVDGRDKFLIRELSWACNSMAELEECFMNWELEE